MSAQVTGATVRGAVRFGLVASVGAMALVAPARLSDRDRRIRPAEQEQGACLAAGCPEAIRERQVARIEDHLYARMPGLDPALHEDLARAILAETETARIDPLMVLAVIQVESAFDPAAVSAAGAVGLMQLLPSTLQREAEGLGLSEGDSGDPVANVRAGVRYLRRCLDSYPDQELALMAYNAGPNRLYGWIQAGGPVPAEVTGYARKVQAELRRLRRLIPEETGPKFADARPSGR
jgi:soluble lytic murein transglycosylase-like protein